MYCKLCNFTSDIDKYFNQHCNTKTHLSNEQHNKYCVLCDKTYKSIDTYNNHKKIKHVKKIKKSNTANNTINNTTDNNTTNINININNKLDDIKDEIKHEIKEVKEEIQNSKKEVVTVVNKAITKASSLIKYLMQTHRSVPPLKKIKKEECIPILRLDYDCPEIEGDYSLQKIFIRDYFKNIFVQNIAKSILKIINHDQIDKQPIYNTDSSRYNYVVKTSTELWNEDKSGIKFTDYIIRPLLRYIRELNEDYITNVLDKVNMYKNTLYQNEMHINEQEAACNLDISVTNDYLIKPLLKELSPHLRFLQQELEELEKIEELNNIQNELEDFINSNNSESDSKSESSEEEPLKPIKKSTKSTKSNKSTKKIILSDSEEEKEIKPVKKLKPSSKKSK